MVREDEAPTVVDDLTEEEAARFEGAPAITADDVLDVHDWLQDLPADVSGFFTEEVDG
jgi:hypothetical protein